MEEKKDQERLKGIPHCETAKPGVRGFEPTYTLKTQEGRYVRRVLWGLVEPGFWGLPVCFTPIGDESKAHHFTNPALWCNDHGYEYVHS